MDGVRDASLFLPSTRQELMARGAEHRGGMRDKAWHPPKENMEGAGQASPPALSCGKHGKVINTSGARARESERAWLLRPFRPKLVLPFPLLLGRRQFARYCHEVVLSLSADLLYFYLSSACSPFSSFQHCLKSTGHTTSRYLTLFQIIGLLRLEYLLSNSTVPLHLFRTCSYPSSHHQLRSIRKSWNAVHPQLSRNRVIY
ncbi:hypothetical protein BDP55DRAFT_303663 [Colletotrichum godetiae]|uniref:Uncharacterized protein n=1 Tax=Colletotrichum godetiae TaxID=1209918 RepID=A0AAJ0AUN8_9PEZI|nr:uncharacterized protein BDP55DRAFT_303663 [Colletotrichum godetiae]KAK1690697.1 hypothetical protein BDP55DRAFT_303663 [Colletotrichum godetiae]